MLGWFKKKFKKKEEETPQEVNDQKIPVAPREFPAKDSEETAAEQKEAELSPAPEAAEIDPSDEETSPPEVFETEQAADEIEGELLGEAEDSAPEPTLETLAEPVDLIEESDSATVEQQTPQPETKEEEEVQAKDEQDTPEQVSELQFEESIEPENSATIIAEEPTLTETEDDEQIAVQPPVQHETATIELSEQEIPDSVDTDNEETEPAPVDQAVESDDEPVTEPEAVEEREQNQSGEQPDDSEKIPVASTHETVEPAETTESTEKKSESGFFKRLSEKLSRTRDAFTHQLDSIFLGKKEIDAELLDELEELLITADLGVATTEEILDHARKQVKRKELSDPAALKKALKKKIKKLITDYQEDAELVMPAKGPFVIMVVGVNGVGKTTTIGKIAHKFLQSEQSVLLIAADTFRAAAVSQLKIWGERNNIPVISQHEGADPSSVVFDGLAHAKAKNYDVVLVDTAGRLHTQANLMEELKKIKRVMKKQLPGSPHEVMLVVDATTGQNGISQAKLFDAAVDLTGITLTKLDGTAKGGIVANICRELKTPIRFIGVGEQLEDLRDFDPDEFVEALFTGKAEEIV